MRASEQSWPMAADLYGEMQLEAVPPAKRRLRDYLPGAFVTAIAALAAAWLADHYAAPLVLMGLLIIRSSPACVRLSCDRKLIASPISSPIRTSGAA